mgnify:CR=1 FL=1
MEARASDDQFAALRDLAMLELFYSSGPPPVGAHTGSISMTLTC